MGIGHAAGYGRWAAGPQGEGASVLRCEMFDDCLHLLRAVLRNDQYVVAVGHDDQVGYANDGDAPPFAGAKIIARRVDRDDVADADRSEEHPSELQSLMRISHAVFCLKKTHIQTILINDT